MNKEPMYRLKKHLEEKYGNDFDIELYYGDIKADKREEIRSNMEKSKRKILIGTYGSISVGVSILNLFLEIISPIMNFVSPPSIIETCLNI